MGAQPVSSKSGHANFVHLRVRSIYSLLEGAVRPKELAKLAREMRMPAVAVTDTNNLFGTYEISDALAKSGIQPIVGVTLSVDMEAGASPQVHPQASRAYPSVALLVKDDQGYVQLSKLLSSAYLEVGAGELPHASAEHLAVYAQGLILLTGGPNGPVNRLLAEGQPQAAELLLDTLSADLPEASETTIEFAGRCASRPKKRNPILPQFIPESGLSPADELRAQAEAGLKRRLADHGLFGDEKTYWDRLQFELGVIIGMDFPGYFLIVSDFMKWTRANGIPVGVRGSGATSLVAWALDITNLDPIRFGLVFERFLNPERISMPDFDIDFCQERRDEVVRYVQQKYGRDPVGQIIE